MRDHEVHKYKRIKLGPRRVYRCTLSNCTHYLTRELVIGMLTICWRCGKEVRMTPQMAHQVKPHCRECNWNHVGVVGRDNIGKVKDDATQHGNDQA